MLVDLYIKKKPKTTTKMPKQTNKKPTKTGFQELAEQSCTAKSEKLLKRDVFRQNSFCLSNTHRRNVEAFSSMSYNPQLFFCIIYVGWSFPLHFNFSTSTVSLVIMNFGFSCLFFFFLHYSDVYDFFPKRRFLLSL